MIEQVPTLPIEVAKRPMHFFWVADHSGSMHGKKIATLNQAIREAIPEVRKAVSAHPEVQILMRAIKFSDFAEWHVGPQPVDVDNFSWSNLMIAGGTGTSQAIRLLSSELKTSNMPKRGYPPVMILMSDGFCTDSPGEYDTAIKELLDLPWGKKSVRLAIGIGAETGYDENELLKFVSHPEIGVLKANTPEQLINFICWASVAASVSSSLSKSGGGNITSQNVIISPPPSAPAPTNKTDVF